jgi:hypothetical protein
VQWRNYGVTWVAKCQWPRAGGGPLAWKLLKMSLSNKIYTSLMEEGPSHNFATGPLVASYATDLAKEKNERYFSKPT